MGATVWSLMSNVVLPPGVALLILVTFPLPDILSKYSTSLVSFLMDMRLFHFTDRFAVTAFGFLFAIAILSFGTQCYELFSVVSNHRYGGGRTRGLPIDVKASIWRTERNFWISTCILLVYWCLYRYRKLQKRFSKIKEDLKKTEEVLKKAEAEMKNE